MSDISSAAIDLIIACEVTDEATYRAQDQRPTWPGGSSGVTIGIGYDLGYATPDQVRADWQMLVATDTYRLAQVAGVKGFPAKAAADALHDIVVPWESACAVFHDRTLGQTAALVRTAFPGADALPPDSFGALVSLVYNRGASVSDPTGRRVEMLAIRDALAERRPEDIPAYIRSMKRLWPVGCELSGLRPRRDAEAKLFENGINPTKTEMET